MSKEICEAIHRSSMEMLEKIGFRCPDEPMLELLRENGIEVVGDRAFFKEGQIMALVKRAPSAFTVYARNPEHDMRIGSGSPWFAAGYGAALISDFNGNKRAAHFSDYVNFLKIVQQCEHFHLNGGMLIPPSEMDLSMEFPLLLFSTMALSDKCLICGTGGPKESVRVIEMLKIAFGDTLVEKPRLFALVNTLSPLALSKESCVNIRVFAENGQPLIVSPAPMSGMTAPVTVLGHLALVNAEALAAIAIAQMVRPGTPVIYGVQGQNADLKVGLPAMSSPESAKVAAYCGKMARHYGLPSRTGGAKTDAKMVDVQCGYESMMLFMATCVSDIDLIIHSAGLLDSSICMSYEKFMVDIDLISMLSRYLKKFDLTADMPSLESIKEGVKTGEFLTSKFTQQHFRDAHFMPEIGIRGKLKDGETPGDRILANISKKMDSLLSNYTKPALDDGVFKALSDYLADLNSQKMVTEAIRKE